MAFDLTYGFLNASKFPLAITAHWGATISDAVRWLRGEREVLRRRLQEHGAVLFRGFPTSCADSFADLVAAFGGESMDYIGGAVPRARIRGRVFNSTELTRLYKIQMHNEMAYQRDYPDFVFFYCNTPPTQGGETIIADGRRICADLDAPVRDDFLRLGVRYVRTFQDRRVLRERAKKYVFLYQHLTWQDAFHVTTRAEVEAICIKRGLGFHWNRQADLVISTCFPAIVTHPQTAANSWFNQVVIQHFNSRNYGPLIYAFRSLLYRDRATLPNQVYYGDGSEIPRRVIEHVMDVTERHTVCFPWQAGDVLLVDNRLVSHGRNPYRGPRKVWVAMAKDSVPSRVDRANGESHSQLAAAGGT